MRPLGLLLDQMLDIEVARQLTSQGHDVVRVADLGMSRADDDMILAESIHQGRILVTLDEHFGDWSVLPLSTHPGVLRVKVNPATTDNVVGLCSPSSKPTAKGISRTGLSSYEQPESAGFRPGCRP